MKRNIILSLFGGAVLSAVALFFAFRNVPIAELWLYLKSINYLWVIPSIAVALFSFVVRVFRWQIILAPARRISFWQAFHPLMIGFMLNCILPGRVGEVARPVILKKRENFPVSAGFATVATERVFDISLLIALFAMVLSTVEIRPDLYITFGSYKLNRETLETISSGMIQLSVAIVVGIVLVTFEKTRRAINRTILRVPGLFFFLSVSGREKLERTVIRPLVRLVENVAEGFSLVRYPIRMMACLGLSILVWFSAALSFYIMALGCPGIRLTFLELSAVLIIICFFIALPSVPGFWGLWEAGGVFALSLFGVSGKDAAGFTLANHAVQMIPVILVGLVSAVVTGINIVKVAYAEDAT